MVMHGLFDVTRFLSADYGATRSTRVALPIQLLTSAGVRHLLLPGRS
jgi:hypothetical protein